MRYTLCIWLLMLVVLFTACSKDEQQKEKQYNMTEPRTTDVRIEETDIFTSDNFDPLAYWSNQADALDMSNMKSTRTYKNEELTFTVTTCIQGTEKAYTVQINNNAVGYVCVTEECTYLHIDGWDGWTKLIDYVPESFEDIIATGAFTTDIKIAFNDLEYLDTVGHCDRFKTVLISETSLQQPVCISFDRTTGKLQSVVGENIDFVFEPLTDEDFIRDFKVTSAVYEHVAILQAMWDFQAELISQED